MTTELESKVSTRLFAGCCINSEVRMHLNESIRWKHAAILTEGLQEAHYRGKDYLGLYLASSSLTIRELNQLQQKIREQLNVYCPSLQTENTTIYLFPQVFIA